MLVAGDTKGKKRRESVPLTCCQVRRHRHEGSLWLVANGRVYDATLFMYDHPVGPAPMLRGGGRDNTEDAEMHSGGGAARVAAAENRAPRAVPGGGIRVFQPAAAGRAGALSSEPRSRRGSRYSSRPPNLDERIVYTLLMIHSIRRRERLIRTLEP